MEAIAARSVQVLLALSGAYLVALWFVLVVWTYRDIEARSRSFVTQIFSTLLVVLFYVPGVLLYMILRPKESLDVAFQRSLEEEYLLQDLEELPLCAACQRYVEDDFLLCPHCHAQLREACVECARLVDLRWAMCPYCGAAQGGKRVAEPEKVEAPAARWVAPALRRRKPELAASAPIRERETAAVVAPVAEPAADVAAAVEVAAATASATAAAAATTSLTVVPNEDGAAATATSIRPFDRKRTRAAAWRRNLAGAPGNGVNGHEPGENGSADRLSAHATGNGNGASANGHRADELTRYVRNGTDGGSVDSADGEAEANAADAPAVAGKSTSR